MMKEPTKETCDEYNRLVEAFAKAEYQSLYPMILSSNNEEAIDYLSVNLSLLGYTVKRKRVDNNLQLEVTI